MGARDLQTKSRAYLSARTQVWYPHRQEECLMAKQRAVKAKVELHPKYKVPRRLYDIDEEASTGNTRQIAEDFL